MGWVREARRYALQEAQSYLETIQRELYGEGNVETIVPGAPAVAGGSPREREGADLRAMASHGRNGLAGVLGHAFMPRQCGGWRIAARGPAPVAHSVSRHRIE